MRFDELCKRAAELLDQCRAAEVRLATAESCTGGLIAGCLTEIAGSSDVVERGFVSYSDQAKTELLSVPAALIAAHGAVSEPVARAMVEGALANSRAELGVAVTGVAGPGGGTAAKPVGLVYVAAGLRHGPVHVERHLFAGDRRTVRLATVSAAFELCRGILAEAKKN